jgi:putative heme iron utilization protein
MENTSFAPASERYMIDHMNGDHADSNLMYVKVYGNLWEATAARMLRLDKAGMELEVTSASGVQRLRLTFDHRLQDEKDAERTLVAMSRHAQAIIAEKAPSNS